MAMVGVHFKNRTWCTNQSSLEVEPLHGKEKTGRPRTTWRRKLLSELKDNKISPFSDALKRAQSKEDWRTIVRGLRSSYCSKEN